MAIEMISGQDVPQVTKEGVSIVNVFGTWCGPCKMLEPILEDISSENKVYKIDVDHNRDFAQEMKIQGVPSTFIYKDGELRDAITGFVPKEVLERKINEVK